MAVKPLDVRFRRDTDQFAFPFVQQMRRRDDQDHLIRANIVRQWFRDTRRNADGCRSAHQRFARPHTSNQEDTVS